MKTSFLLLALNTGYGLFGIFAFLPGFGIIAILVFLFQAIVGPSRNKGDPFNLRYYVENFFICLGKAIGMALAIWVFFAVFGVPETSEEE